MRSVRSSSPSNPGSADPLRRAAADHAQPKRPVVVDRNVFDRAVEARHTAGDRAAFERRTRGTRRRQDAMPIAQQQLRVRADVHDGDEAIFVRKIRGCGRRRVGANVAADDRQAVDPRVRMDRQQAATAPCRQARRRALAFRDLDLGDRSVRVLPDRVDALAEEQIAHRRIAGEHDVVDGQRIGR
jgi:hypothetical protein